MNAFLKLACAMLYARADEAGAELNADCAHFKISCDRLPAADSAGDEYRDIVADVGKNFLSEHGRRNRADVASRFHSLDHERVDRRAHQLLCKGKRWSKRHQFCAICLNSFDCPARRKAARKNHMSDMVLRADVDQLGKLRVHRDEIDPKGPLRSSPRFGNFPIEEFRGHCSARNHSKAAGVGNCRDETAFADPAHRAAHDRIFAAQELGSAVHQLFEARATDSVIYNP